MTTPAEPPCGAASVVSLLDMPNSATGSALEVFCFVTARLGFDVCLTRCWGNGRDADGHMVPEPFATRRKSGMLPRHRIGHEKAGASVPSCGESKDG